MPQDDINIKQLKEFFDFRMKTQDEAISRIEDNVNKFIDAHSKVIMDTSSKVSLLWKIGASTAALIAAAVAKALGIV